jgi:hypothetical protein
MAISDIPSLVQHVVEVNMTIHAAKGALENQFKEREALGTQYINISKY